jgi:hypothetical protein
MGFGDKIKLIVIYETPTKKSTMLKTKLLATLLHFYQPAHFRIFE